MIVPWATDTSTNSAQRAGAVQPHTPASIMGGVRPRALIRITVAAAFLLYGQDDLDPYSIGVALMQPVGCPVFITDVVPGSPAARAGLKPGDRVRSIDH